MATRFETRKSAERVHDLTRPLPGAPPGHSQETHVTVYPASSGPWQPIAWRINDTVMYRDCSRGAELRWSQSAKLVRYKDFRARAPL